MLAWIGFALSAIPFLLFFRNLRAYSPPGPPSAEDRPRVSVLIPARNEEDAIGAALEAVLRSRDVDLEVVVLDDDSQDGTAAVVAERAARDSRVRLERAPPLPPGWCGKQHACAVLAGHARHDVLVFVDADVRLAPDALARAAGFLESSGADLVSGFPGQVTVTFLERLLLPFMHFLLLGFLPMDFMRLSRSPGFGAGCGQWFVARRSAYEAVGGHGAIRESLHDGVRLPRAFRSAGFRTDLFDATDLASCRMYRSGGEVWRGLAKNATEGLGSPGAIVPWTVILGGGQVLPLVLLVLGLRGGPAAAAAPVAAMAVTFSYLIRFAAAVRFRHAWDGAVLHPLGIVLLLAIQWQALARKALGGAPSWKGRSYPVASR
jgi:glycosyltransferase involved in cell wall biosynthesis